MSGYIINQSSSRMIINPTFVTRPRIKFLICNSFRHILLPLL